MKNISQSFKVITLAFALSIGISYVSAWTAPTQTPPNGNVSAPINVSVNEQIKAGNLKADQLFAYSFKDLSDPTYFLKPNGDSKLKNVIVDNAVTSSMFCLGGSCITSWPAGGNQAPPPPPAPSNPTATITGNDTTYISGVDPLSTFTWKWSATNANTFSTSYVISGCTNPANNSTGNTPLWSLPGATGNGGNGTLSGIPGTGFYGCTDTVTYKAIDSATGLSATANATVVFKTLNAPLATLTINGTTFANNVDPLLPRTWAWSSTGADSFSSKAVTTGCTDPTQNVTYDPWDPWTPPNGTGTAASGSNTAVPGAGRYGCTVVATYTAKNTVTNQTTTASATLVFKQPVYAPGQTTYANPGAYTFTVPPAVTLVNVEVWGGGAGAGSNSYSKNYDWSAQNHTGGGGGGSGGYVKKLAIPVTSGSQIPVVVGGGGAGGAQGGWGNRPPAQTYSGGGGYSSFGTSGNNNYAYAAGGFAARNYDYSCGGGGCNGMAFCDGSYSAQGGNGGNPGAACSDNGPADVGPTTAIGTAGGAAVIGDHGSAGAGGGPTVGIDAGAPGAPGKVVVWW